MLRKSVETRDWLSTLEPRNVRAVMKRVVEDTTAIDVQVLHRPAAGTPMHAGFQGPRQKGSGCTHVVPLEASFHTCGMCRPKVTQKAEAGMS